MKNSEEQNIGFLLQCFKLCGEFTPFPLQPGLTNVQNVVFRFSASNKESSICSEHCGAGPACHSHPWWKAETAAKQPAKEGKEQRRKGDREKSQSLSCSRGFASHQHWPLR